MGKTILITGATDGVGKATAELLANNRHEIIIHARSRSKGERIEGEIRKKTGNEKVTCIVADFTGLSEISGMVSDIKMKFSKIDVLINNAGVYRMKKNMLPNGLEETFMVNHLAHFYLTLKLLPLLKPCQFSQHTNRFGRVFHIVNTNNGRAI